MWINMTEPKAKKFERKVTFFWLPFFLYTDVHKEIVPSSGLDCKDFQWCYYSVIWCIQVGILTALYMSSANIVVRKYCLTA